MKNGFSTDKAQMSPVDQFEFTAAEDDGVQIALLLPAVQKAEAAPDVIDDFAGNAGDGDPVGYTLVELLEIRSTRRVDDEGEWTDMSGLASDGDRPMDDSADVWGGAGFAADSIF